MDPLLNRIFDLTKKARENQSERGSAPPTQLIERQKDLQVHLSRWLDTYNSSTKFLRGHGSMDEEKAHVILSVYHTMATIMANTCLSPDDEMAFDLHMDRFSYIIKQLLKLGTLDPIVRFQASGETFVNMSKSVMDMGWNAPLYFVAVKCRVHQIRLQAVQLLESAFHREGIWDSRVTACVSRRIMEVEERDFYRTRTTTDGLQLQIPIPEPLRAEGKKCGF
ncbi:hypothetical protein LSUE1_G004428 [Lachnellula suecica]|uniref:Uncharacterized protein n=1 Tax=Lachnellula suecica TaxID=602035 RepID=A0A8T9C9K2_9HELO|nr:hypothetical protein LSUE1_G004428 [Lachnellula suecica]